MVNFKASSHAGQHARAQASIAAEHREGLVSKVDKLPCKAGEASGDGTADLVLKVAWPLRGSTASSKVCKVAPSCLKRIRGIHGVAGGERVLLRRPGGDCVLTAVAEEGLEDDVVVLSEVEARNLRVCPNEAYTWEIFTQHLSDVRAVFMETWLKDPDQDESIPASTLPSHVLHKALHRALFGHVVSENELTTAVSVDLDGRARELVLRISGILGGGGSVDDTASSPTSPKIVSDHTWRGTVGVATEILVERLEPSSSEALDGHRAPSTRFHLTAEEATKQRVSTLRCEPAFDETLTVNTTDEEYFQVHPALLKSCISLNRAIRHATQEGTAAVDVPVDCLTMDKVLIYLETVARGRSYEPDIATAEQLRPAALALGCRSLLEICDAVLDNFCARRRVFRFSEVVEHNRTPAGCWILLDGMVLDVERWLPEHPGGATIIPAQARNVDATVFFELFHASRESFTLCREFYIGEVGDIDVPSIPLPSSLSGLPNSDGKASEDFINQLRAFCSPFRLEDRTLAGPEQVTSF